MGKKFRNLKERMRSETRARVSEKAESLLNVMSSSEPRAGHAAEASARANENETATADGAD